MTIGIYKIVNTINGNTYVGQSINIEYRFRKHAESLNRGKHDNSHLQNAWNKYGSNAFEFSIIETCDKDKLTQLEQFHADTLKEQGITLYNIGKCTDNPFRGLSHSDTTKQKMSIAKKGKYIGENNPNFGKICSIEIRQKMSKAQKGKVGRKHKLETIQKLSKINKGKNNPMSGKFGKDNHRFGIRHSPETLAKMSKNRKGKLTGESHFNSKLTWEKVREIRKLYAQGNITYSELAERFNCGRSTISHIVLRNTWKE